MTQAVPSSAAQGCLCATQWMTKTINYTNDISLLSSYDATSNFRDVVAQYIKPWIKL